MLCGIHFFESLSEIFPKSQSKFVSQSSWLCPGFNDFLGFLLSGAFREYTETCVVDGTNKGAFSFMEGKNSIFDADLVTT